MEMDGLLDAVGRDADADGLGGAGLDVSGGRLASGFDSGIPVPDVTGKEFETSKKGPI